MDDEKRAPVSDFAGAREHLQNARSLLCGDDETSRNGREALDLLIDAMVTAAFEHSRDTGETIWFRRWGRTLKNYRKT